MTESRSGKKMASKDVRRRKRRLLQLYQHCMYCSELLDEHTASLDHVKPRHLGGEDGLTNLVLACRLCNRRKGARPGKVVKRNENGIPVLATCFLLDAGLHDGIECGDVPTVCYRPRRASERMSETLAGRISQGDVRLFPSSSYPR